VVLRLSDSEAIDPSRQARFRLIAAQDFTLLEDGGVRDASFQTLNGLAKAAAAGSRKEYDRLPGEIVAFEKGVDNGRRDIPPNRKAYENFPGSGNNSVNLILSNSLVCLAARAFSIIMRHCITPD
jgi:hypothetical protein